MRFQRDKHNACSNNTVVDWHDFGFIENDKLNPGGFSLFFVSSSLKNSKISTGESGLQARECGMEDLRPLCHEWMFYLKTGILRKNCSIDC
jgi:hypothetical protein